MCIVVARGPSRRARRPPLQVTSGHFKQAHEQVTCWFIYRLLHKGDEFVVVVVVAVVVCRRGLAQMPLHRIAPAASLPERAAADEPARNG